MRSTLRRGLFFSFLLALALPLASCDSGGSDGDSTPVWVGTWKVETVNGDSPDSLLYWNLSEEELDIREEREAAKEGCESTFYSVVEEGDNTIVLSGVTDNAMDRIELEVEPSEGAVTLVFEGSGREVNLTSVDEIPLSEEKCTSDPTPKWIGEWRVTETTLDTPPGEYYFSITRDEWNDIYEDSENTDCDINSFQVDSYTLESVDLVVDDEPVRYSAIVSDGSLTVENQEDDDVENSWEAEPISDDPKELAGCQ